MTDKIKVGVRVRPPLAREIEDGVFNDCVAVEDASSRVYVSMQDQPVILTKQGEVPDGVTAYTFDNVFG